jgi:hypothetical protein
MNIDYFVAANRLQPADAVVLNKKIFGMVDHFAIYLGIQRFEHQFAANYIDGVKVIPKNDLDLFLKEMVATKVERFPGPEHKRGEALKRAINRIGERAYSFFANNCEHYKNDVHYGIKTSSQVTKAGLVVAAGGFGVMLTGVGKKTSEAIWWGIIIMIVGIVIAALGTGDNNKQPPIPPLGKK